MVELFTANVPPQTADSRFVIAAPAVGDNATVDSRTAGREGGAVISSMVQADNMTATTGHTRIVAFHLIDIQGLLAVGVENGRFRPQIARATDQRRGPEPAPDCVT